LILKPVRSNGYDLSLRPLTSVVKKAADERKRLIAGDV
jgi:hypothetical protein